MTSNPNLHNIAGVKRAINARKRAKDIYISTNSHREVQDAMEILRLTYQGERGEPMTGLRLSQVSSAGKSAMLMDYVKRTLAIHASKTGCYNPYLVLYINLLTVTTPKMLCQAILRALGDPNYLIGNTDELTHRMQEFLVRAGTELLLIDEVQQLMGRSKSRSDVADQFKNLLNLGICPIVFVGDETSTRLFEDNIQLANRTGVPLRLDPIRAEQKGRHPEFKSFCVRLEKQMIAKGAIATSGWLSDPLGINHLRKWSAGHLGRVSRIIMEALQHSALRNARTIEKQDVDYAVKHFAMPRGYIAEAA